MANTGDNYGAVLEALNDKMDRDVENRSTGVETVVEHWHEGTEWYRVWSDGFIEQGGFSNPNVTINLHKPYTSTNYNIQITGKYNQATGTGYWNSSNISCNITTNSFYIGSANNTGVCYWYTCGY